MAEQEAKQGSRLKQWAIYILIVILVAGATVGVMMLLQNIATRKKEARQDVFRVVELDETTVDPKIWARNYPKQYDSYVRTVDTEETRYGGSEAIQKLDRYPIYRELFNGYAFGFDYREERGHAYMLSDQRETERLRVGQPGACLHCHAADIPAYRKVGKEHGAPGELDAPLDSKEGREQLFKGFEIICAMPYEEATKLVEHPVTCLDCHDPKTMRIRVTRPAFITGIAVLARSDDPMPHMPSIERWRKGDRKKDYDANELASRQELRSLVCAQCHVEYYFKGDGKLLTYPWHHGLQAEEAYEHYQTAGKDGEPFKDWTHKTSKAPMLKAQHPEFELWSQGIHARSGVSCADCHMPYERHGAVKVSSHHVRSPLLNINNACQTCHRYTEDELKQRVHNIQDKTQELMKGAEQACLDLIKSIKAAMDNGATDEQLKVAREHHRKAQWYLDFVAAENSMGFHASQESARLLGQAMDIARQGQVQLLKTVGDKAIPKDDGKPADETAKAPAKDGAS